MLQRRLREDGNYFIIPDTYALTLWRNIISSLYSHPTLLIHPDMFPFRYVFIENNVIHNSPTEEIFLPIPPPTHPNLSLRPKIMYPEIPLQAMFGEVSDFVQMETGISVRRFTLQSYIKKAAAELADFIRLYPQGLYEDEYGFIYDFLVRFGLLPKVIDKMIEEAKRHPVILPPAVQQTEEITSSSSEMNTRIILEPAAKRKRVIVVKRPTVKRRESKVRAKMSKPSSVDKRKVVVLVQETPEQICTDVSSPFSQIDADIEPDVADEPVEEIHTPKKMKHTQAHEISNIVIEPAKANPVVLIPDVLKMVPPELKPETTPDSDSEREPQVMEVPPISNSSSERQQSETEDSESGIVNVEVNGVKINVRKFNLRKVSIDINDCLEDVEICKKYFNKKEKKQRRKRGSPIIAKPPQSIENVNVTNVSSSISASSTTDVNDIISSISELEEHFTTTPPPKAKSPRRFHKVPINRKMKTMFPSRLKNMSKYKPIVYSSDDDCESTTSSNNSMDVTC